MKTHNRLQLLLVVFLTYLLEDTICIRVCKSFHDYLIPFNKNCHNNPDAESNTTQIIQRWGFDAEEYYITTEDGYILLLNHGYSNNSNRIPVVLAHGIGLSGISFVDRGNKSLAYLLIDAGFDVWILNFRGSKYSRSHQQLSDNSLSFWNFSFHEMGMYDMRKTIDYVYGKTGGKSIVVGYSMGSTASFIYGSAYAEEAQNRVNHFITLAPVAYLGHFRSIIRFFIPFIGFLKLFVNTFSHGEFLHGRQLPSQFICGYNPILMVFCEIGKGIIFGEDLAQMDPEDLPVINVLNTDSISMKVLEHYSQLVSNNKFQQYDYGGGKNSMNYGQNSPPQYNLSKILTPITMYVAKNDLIATTKDSQRAYSELQDNVKAGYNIITFSRFSHNDFLVAREIVSLINQNVTNLIKNLS